MAEKATKKGLFQTLYGAGKEVLDGISKDLYARELKRQFEAAYDSAEGQRLKAEKMISQAQENLRNYDLAGIIRLKQTMRDADNTMAEIAEHYEEMFGESIARG